MQPDDGERVPVTVEEVEIAISKLKNGKSPGICGISAEMLKAGRTVVVKWLHRIMSLAWDNGQVPEDPPGSKTASRHCRDNLLHTG